MCIIIAYKNIIHHSVICVSYRYITRHHADIELHLMPRALSIKSANFFGCPGGKGCRTERSMVLRVSVRVLKHFIQRQTAVTSIWLIILTWISCMWVLCRSTYLHVQYNRWESMCSCLANSSWWLSISLSLTTTSRDLPAPRASRQLPAPEEEEQHWDSYPGNTPGVYLCDVTPLISICFILRWDFTLQRVWNLTGFSAAFLYFTSCASHQLCAGQCCRRLSRQSHCVDATME